MLQWLKPLILLIFFESVADIFAKEWSIHGSSVRWIGAITAYVIANAFWLFALKNGSGLGRGSIIFSIASAILAVIIGIFLYQEQTTKIQIVGMLLGIISLVLIFWE